MYLFYHELAIIATYYIVIKQETGWDIHGSDQPIPSLNGKLAKGWLFSVEQTIEFLWQQKLEYQLGDRQYGTRRFNHAIGNQLSAAAMVLLPDT